MISRIDIGRLVLGGLVAAATILWWSEPVRAAGESPALAYVLHCVGCHMEDGSGTKMGGVPPLPGKAGHLLKHEKGRLYLAHVPGVTNAGLPADETAALLNYVLETWAANDAPSGWRRFTGAEIRQLRDTKVDDITGLRGEIAADLAKQGIDISY